MDVDEIPKCQAMSIRVLQKVGLFPSCVICYHSMRLCRELMREYSPFLVMISWNYFCLNLEN